jgi:hypothetical protein
MAPEYGGILSKKPDDKAKCPSRILGSNKDKLANLYKIRFIGMSKRILHNCKCPFYKKRVVYRIFYFYATFILQTRPNTFGPDKTVVCRDCCKMALLKNRA